MTYRQERQFAALFAALFAVTAAWPLWSGSAPQLPWLAAAAALLALAFVRPRALTPVLKAWLALGHALGWVSSKIILALVFFLVVTPTGLAMRLSRRNLLGLQRAGCDSDWVVRDQPWAADSLRDQY